MRPLGTKPKLGLTHNVYDYIVVYDGLYRADDLVLWNHIAMLKQKGVGVWYATVTK